MGVTTTTVLNTSNTLTAREIDFVTRFNTQWDLLRKVMGIVRPIRKTPGTALAYYTAERVGTIPSSPAEGVSITATEYQVKKAGTFDLEIEKYRKTVSIEAVAKYGAQIAVEKTDDQFLADLQSKVMSDFYAFLKLGTLTGHQSTWQRCIAMGQGAVIDKFAAMNKTITGLVGFIGIMDLYDYLGDKEVTIQTAFGLQYVKDFLGFQTLFLVPSNVLSGQVIVLPVENVDCYYIDPSDSEFAKLGLSYTTAGETNLIGFHAAGNYDNATGDMFALMGMKLWAEYIDGIAVITLDKAKAEADVDKAPAVASGAKKGLSDGK